MAGATSSDDAYAAANPDWHGDDAPCKVAGLLGLLDAAGLRPASIVEVGCGLGAVLVGLRQGLAARGQQVRCVGWDVAATPIARGRAAADAAGVTLRCGDALQAGEPADVALVVDVLEHVGDDVAFLRALRRLAPVLVARVPLERSVLDVVRPGRVLAARQRYGHRHHYQRETLAAVLEEAGWRPTHWRYDRVPVPAATPRAWLLQQVRTALLARWPAPTTRLLGGASALVIARAGA